MAGLLDYLLGNNGAASPWSALYPSALLAPDSSAANAAAYGSMGVDPTTLPQVDPFGDPSKSSVANPTAPAAPAAPAPATGFGAGATPFGFAGPGSMTGINPANFSAPMGPPASASAPAVAAAPAQPPTEASSVNRSSAPDDYIPVGGYQMPAFRNRGAPMDAQASATEEGDQPPPQQRLVVNAAPVRPDAAPFSLGGAGDRLGMSTRGFLGNLHNGSIAAIAGGIGSLLTGKESDPSAIARQKVNASAQALISKGASPAEAAAAVDNPALMTALINQYYGKDKWTVVKTGKDADGNEVYMQQNQMDGTLRPLPGSAAPAAGGAASTVTGPDGKPIAVPPGVDRKTFIKRVSETAADAATGKKTEAQAKASSFAARMQQAEQDLSKLQNEGLSGVQAVTSSVPVVGNYLQTTDHQKFETAKSAFITAMLRQESGAAVNKSEFSRYEKELFPQPGDAPEVVKQKAQLRAAAIEQMKGAAGPGYQPPAATAAGSRGKTSSGISWSVQ